MSQQNSEEESEDVIDGEVPLDKEEDGGIEVPIAEEVDAGGEVLIGEQVDDGGEALIGEQVDADGDGIQGQAEVGAAINEDLAAEFGLAPTLLNVLKCVVCNEDIDGPLNYMCFHAHPGCDVCMNKPKKPKCPVCNRNLKKVAMSVTFNKINDAVKRYNEQ